MASRLVAAPARSRPDDVAFLQYTGGTTGVSKGATLLHRNVVANIMQTRGLVQADAGQLGDQHR